MPIAKEQIRQIIKENDFDSVTDVYTPKSTRHTMNTMPPVTWQQGPEERIPSAMSTTRRDSGSNPLPRTGATAYAYDEAGNRTTETDALGNTTVYTYNAVSLLERVTLANGSVSQLNYALDGSLLGEVNGEGSETFYSYDALGRLISTTDALGNAAAYEYDAAGSARVSLQL